MPRRLQGPLVLVALSALGGCDALLGLGERPPEGAEASSTSGDASGSVTTTGTGQGTSSTGGGGDGGGTASSVSSGGSGGQGGGGGALSAICGTCTGNPDCDCAPGGDDRCRVRRWVAPDTHGGEVTPSYVINRFGRGLAVTDDWVVFTRNVQVSGGVKHMLTYVGRADGTAVGDLTLAGESGLGTVAAGNGRIIVNQVGSITAPIYEVTFSDEPPSLVQRVSKEETQLLPPGVLAWSGTADRFVYGHRGTGELYTFLLDTSGSLCQAGTAGKASAISDVEVAGGSVFLLRYFGSNFAEGPAAAGCSSNAMNVQAFGGSISVANALAIDGDDLFLQGIQAGGTPITFRADAPDTRQVISHPSAALIAKDGFVYLPDPTGGVRKCPGTLDMPGLQECELVLAKSDIGYAAVLESIPGGLIGIGYDGSMSDATADGFVVCLDER